jgi:hypothetical protein
MSVNGITTNNATTYTTAATTTAAATTTTAQTGTTTAEQETPAAVYEKSDSQDSTKKVYKQDTATINQLLADMETRKQQMADLVAKTLQKQGQTYNTSMNIFDMLKSGNLKFSAADIAQAKEDVSDDGYWGVEQTAERIYSFAYALAGGDSSKADTLLAAIEKGYSEAAKAWGGELPDISSKTMDAVREKIANWKNGTTTEATATE